MPDNPKTFSFDSFSFDLSKAEALFYYSIDDRIRFSERLVFHRVGNEPTAETRHALDIALRYLHLALGVSYYKALLPQTIEVRTGALAPDAAAFFSALYTKGLGEFSYVNQIDLAGRIVFPSGGGELTCSAVPLKRRTVVPLGGGKDSLVTVELLRPYEKALSTLLVGDYPLLQPLIERIGLPHIAISRDIDSRLFQLNAAGAYNGHVPFSALLAFIMPVAALLYGFDTVVMSQERSSDSGNLLYRGEEVNHQYSKSFEFEAHFARFARQAILADFSYFSLIRPLSELSVTERFSKLTQYHQAFTSCNRAFTRTASTGKRWCGNCPKCRFVFLALAPFLHRNELVEIFGRDLLSEADQVAGYQELLGLQGHKPFECVGEAGECRAALSMLLERKEWKDRFVVRELGDEVQRVGAPSITEVLSPSERHQIPARYLELLHAPR